jgi:hypothetical protein
MELCRYCGKDPTCTEPESCPNRKSRFHCMVCGEELPIENLPEGIHPKCGQLGNALMVL